jgi:Zn-dependent peptidase ImmA (M78 family)
VRPRAAANQITLVIRKALPSERWFPVDPLRIARELGIEIFDDDLGQGIEGAMLSSNGKSAIVINSRVKDPGRRSFTGAHELGHYSLHRDRKELRCSFEDLVDMAPHPVNIEQEANEFAMTLLMPIDDVREQSGHDVPSISMVKRLAARYGTSLTATALRLRESSSVAFALAYVVSGRLKWWWPTSRFQWRMKKGQPWPSALSVCDVPALCVTRDFFVNEAEARVGSQLRISGVDMPSYDASLWVVEAPDARKPWE